MRKEKQRITLSAAMLNFFLKRCKLRFESILISKTMLYHISLSLVELAPFFFACVILNNSIKRACVFTFLRMACQKMAMKMCSFLRRRNINKGTNSGLYETLKGFSEVQGQNKRE